jgi:hypothetical protein
MQSLLADAVGRIEKSILARATAAQLPVLFPADTADWSAPWHADSTTSLLCPAPLDPLRARRAVWGFWSRSHKGASGAVKEMRRISASTENLVAAARNPNLARYRRVHRHRVGPAGKGGGVDASRRAVRVGDAFPAENTIGKAVDAFFRPALILTLWMARRAHSA